MKLTIRARLLAAFSLVLALACGLGLFGIYELRNLKANADEVTGNWMPSVKAINAVTAKLADLRIVHFQMLIAADLGARSKLDQQAREDQAQLIQIDQHYQGLISSTEERELHGQFLDHWKRYTMVASEFRSHLLAGREDEAKLLLQNAMPKESQPAAAELDAMVALNQRGADTEAKHVSETYSRAVTASAITIAVMLLASLVLAWRTANNMGRRMRQATAVADGIAAGQLTQQINVQGQDEIAELQQALSRMQAQLAQVVGEVRQNAESVATASAQIAQGNQDLSSRTEEQASALQQTAASMEQLGATVKQNADNAQQANQLALGASNVAVKGGEVVDQVVRTMREINSSSSKIADIISVIDSIAFQTNILALNAAVEAARAGEQGRGFAVVASEVRNLAQRSAEAAKEIKALITASVERVEQGTSLVDQAGSTMTEVVTAIRRVTDIMGEISAASTEQNTGVAQVGEAVGQMDQTTQQNAALVEESAAAAESLSHQAQQLVQAVSVFQLGAVVAQPTLPVQRTAPLVKKTMPKPAPVKQQAPAPVLASAAAGDWASF